MLLPRTQASLRVSEARLDRVDSADVSDGLNIAGSQRGPLRYCAPCTGPQHFSRNRGILHVHAIECAMNDLVTTKSKEGDAHNLFLIPPTGNFHETWVSPLSYVRPLARVE